MDKIQKPSDSGSYAGTYKKKYIGIFMYFSPTLDTGLKLKDEIPLYGTKCNVMENVM
jgi:hypothetical protein